MEWVPVGRMSLVVRMLGISKGQTLIHPMSAEGEEEEHRLGTKKSTELSTYTMNTFTIFQFNNL